MLVFLNGSIVEIRPGETFTSDKLLDIKYLELQKAPKPPVKRTRKKSSDESESVTES